MNQRVALKIARFLTLVFWAVIIFNFIVPIVSPKVSTIINYIGVITFFIHVLEIVIFMPRLQQRSNKKKSFFNALVYGMFEIVKWRKP